MDASMEEDTSEKSLWNFCGSFPNYAEFKSFCEERGVSLWKKYHLKSGDKHVYRCSHQKLFACPYNVKAVLSLHSESVTSYEKEAHNHDEHHSNFRIPDGIKDAVTDALKLNMSARQIRQVCG